MEGSAYVLVGNGGVGRTTTALHLGAALERQGHNTAVVDGDLNMTDMASLLDVDPDASIHDVLDRNASVNDAVVHGPDDVTIVPGASGSTAELDHDDKGAKLDRVVEPLRAAHDIILIDSPPELQPIHRDIMENVDGAILVTTPDESAIETAQDGTKAANLLSCDALGVMLMQTTSMTDESDIVNRVGAPALASVPESKVLTEARNYIDVGGTVQESFEAAAVAVGEHVETGRIDEATLYLTVEEAESTVQSETSEESTSLDEWETPSGSSFTPPDAPVDADSEADSDDSTAAAGGDEAASASAESGGSETTEAESTIEDAAPSTDSEDDGEEEQPKTLDDVFEEDESGGGVSDRIGGAIYTVRKRIANIGSGGSSSRGKSSGGKSSDSDDEPVNPLDVLQGEDE